MSYDIPQRWEPHIEQIAEAQHISQAQALELIMQAGIDKLQPRLSTKLSFSYVSLFGAAKGSGTLGSREAVELYLAELREE